MRSLGRVPVHPHELAIELVAAVCIGLSKAGFSGISLVAVFLFADLHGAKVSVGLVLPLLIAADLTVYPAFRRHGSWRPVWSLLGPALAGIALGWLMLGRMSDQQARQSIGAMILVMAGLQVAGQLGWLRPERWLASRPFGVATGVAGGVATMMANAAGPVIQIYLLARKVPKMELIGISARFFLLINLLKLPLNSQLALITPASLAHNLLLLPAVLAGIFGGKALIRRVPQRIFCWLILLFALASGVRLMLPGRAACIPSPEPGFHPSCPTS